MSREAGVLAAVIEAIDTLTDDFDLIDSLHRLSVRCVELLDVSEAGIVIADQFGVLQTIAASSESTRLLELFAIQQDQGPCVDCYRTGTQRLDIELDSDGATAEFGVVAERALETGFVCAHTLPLRLRSRTVGAMALFQTRRRGLTESDARVAQALADVATIAILQQRSLTRTSMEKAQLQNALTSRIGVEQAKGVLAERMDITMEEAFRVLRSFARPRGLRISELAQQVVTGALDTRELRA